MRPLDYASLITEIGAQRTAFAEPDRVVITAGTRALCQDLHLARPTLPCVCAEHSLEHRLLSRPERDSPYKAGILISGYVKTQVSTDFAA